MESCTYIWNEDACAGYVLNAMQHCGVDDDLIIKILNELYLQIDEVSFEDAAADAKQYLKAYYDKNTGRRYPMKIKLTFTDQERAAFERVRAELLQTLPDVRQHSSTAPSGVHVFYLTTCKK